MSFWNSITSAATAVTSSVQNATTAVYNTATGGGNTNNNNNSSGSSNNINQLHYFDSKTGRATIIYPDFVRITDSVSTSSIDFPTCFCPALREMYRRELSHLYPPLKKIVTKKGETVEIDEFDEEDEFFNYNSADQQLHDGFDDAHNHNHNHNNSNNNAASSSSFRIEYTNKDIRRRDGQKVTYQLKNQKVLHAMKLLEYLQPGGGEDLEAYEQLLQQQQQQQQQQQYDQPLENNNSFASGGGRGGSSASSSSSRRYKMNSVSKIKELLRESFDDAKKRFADEQSGRHHHHRGGGFGHHGSSAAHIMDDLFNVATIAFLFRIKDFSDAFASVARQYISQSIHPQDMMVSSFAHQHQFARNNTFASQNDLTTMTPPRITSTQEYPTSTPSNNNKSRNNKVEPILYELLKDPGNNKHAGITGLPPDKEMRLAVSCARKRLFRDVYCKEPNQMQEKVDEQEWKDYYEGLFPQNVTGSVSQVYQSANDTLGSDKQSSAGTKGQPLARLRYEEDDNVKQCPNCNAEFSKTRAIFRSHCRCCGRIFCKSCLDPTTHDNNNLIARRDLAFPTDSSPKQKSCLDCTRDFGEGARVRFLQDLIERCGFSIPETHILATIDMNWFKAATRVLRLYRESIYTDKPDPRHDRMILATAEAAVQHPQLLLRLVRLQSKMVWYKPILPMTTSMKMRAPRNNSNTGENTSANNNTNSPQQQQQQQQPETIKFAREYFVTSQLFDMIHPDFSDYRASVVADQISDFVLGKPQPMIFSHNQLDCTRSCYFADEDPGTFAVMILAAIAQIPSTYHRYVPVLIHNHHHSNSSNSNTNSNPNSDSNLSVHHDDETPPNNDSSSNEHFTTQHQRQSSSVSSTSLHQAGGSGYFSSSSSSSYFHHHQHELTPITWKAPLPKLPLYSSDRAEDPAYNGAILYEHSEIENEPIRKIREACMIALVGDVGLTDNMMLMTPAAVTTTTAATTNANFTGRAFSTFSASPTPRNAELLSGNNNNTSSLSSRALQRHNDRQNNKNDDDDDNDDDQANNDRLLNTNNTSNNNFNNHLHNHINNNTTSPRNFNNTFSLSSTRQDPLVRTTPASRISVWLYALTDMLTKPDMDHHAKLVTKTIIKSTIVGNRKLLLKVFNEIRSRKEFVPEWDHNDYTSVVDDLCDALLKMRFDHLDKFYSMLVEVGKARPNTSQEVCLKLEEIKRRMQRGSSGSTSGFATTNGTARRFSCTNTSGDKKNTTENGNNEDNNNNATAMMNDQNNCMMHNNPFLSNEGFDNFKSMEENSGSIVLVNSDPNDPTYWELQERDQIRWTKELKKTNTPAATAAAPPSTNTDTNNNNKGPAFKTYNEFMTISNDQPILFPFDANTMIIAIDLSDLKVMSSNSKPIWISLLCQTTDQAINNPFSYRMKRIILKMEDSWRDHLAREFAFILYDLMAGNAPTSSSSGGSFAAQHHHRGSSSSNTNNNNNNGQQHLAGLDFLGRFMYSVLPLGKDCGIVECLPHTVKPLEKVLDTFFEEERKKKKMMQEQQQQQQNTGGKNQQKEQEKAQGVQSIAPVTSYSGLRQYLLSRSDDPNDRSRQVFCRSVQFSILLCHILGVADRHLSNVMLDEKTLAIVDIDFGHMFGSRTLSEQMDLFGRNILKYFGSPQAPEFTCARFDVKLSDAVAELRFQYAQARSEMKKKQREAEEKARAEARAEKEKEMEKNDSPSSNKKSTTKLVKVVVSHQHNDQNNKSGAAASSPSSQPPMTEEERKLAEHKKLLEQRDRELDDFIHETAKLLFTRVRPFTGVISLLFTRSSSYLQDQEDNNTSNSSTVGNSYTSFLFGARNQQQSENNINNNNNSDHNTSSPSSNNNNSIRRSIISNNNSSKNVKIDDDTIATHFFNCFALTKKDSDAIESFKKELKEQRSRFVQDMAHSLGQKGAIELLGSGLESMKDFVASNFSSRYFGSSAAGGK